ncbi:MAG TPA: bifunctional 3,4-dihydroxy-2-butanone-4-phosphate synthase/GTP cyclohydrolase II, partial [Desulfosporosinus sp.]|nr:bifunctional 3,4-dihydroxy-2-butanone-4-phosphate synthase/GTP cyclohydrolase II [Desulfosporosinus sp.]
MSFNTVEEALEDIRQGKMIVMVDDEDRENEGDLVMAAEMATPQAINFMATYGRGLICAPLTRDRIHALQLEPMVTNNTDPHETGFTVSVDSVESTTGISAFERAQTVKILADPNSKPTDLHRP